MSLLKPIDSHFELVSEQYFIDNAYAYSQYTSKGPMSKHGSWFKTDYVKLESTKHIAVRFRYNTDTKQFIVEPTLYGEEYMRVNNITFEEIRINNPSKADIEFAISEVNLQSRFCKLSDVDFG
jgi:hypothetical protein